ncbi:hypothetical protein [Rickettsiella endosymbiont of Dermanyssus gallinae]|uniref:hypothetical protein n=1 Tax=Rickettsiella endosymbiont of Dermanyssus gallinae TaxID=2856608 RepID=UPI001C532A0C|nr:hypothetical protein [Rickettsiella endosymbiont of Dermanyssus gallinae]
MQEFETLQNKVAEKVEKLPSGIHLVRGSFAVKTADNQVMNVTPHITSGSPLTFNLIVKNHTSSIDVRYKEKNANGYFEHLSAFDNRDGSEGAGHVSKIDIDGKPSFFTFNNVIACKTPGTEPFLTAVDICLDHARGVAKINMERLLRENPSAASQPISHMLVSNIIESMPMNCFGAVVHVDPFHSPQGSKKDATQIIREETNTPHFFGSATVRVIDLSFTPCPTVQEAQAMQRMQEYFKRVIGFLENLKFGPKDEVMNKFIQGYKNEFDSALTREEKCDVVSRLNACALALECTLKQDNAVRQVREIIADFRKRAGPFSMGRHAKADKIEAAMSKVSVQDRCNFKQSESCKAVMKELGKHRFFGKKGSAITLKKFKAKFFTEMPRKTSREDENNNVSPRSTCR